MSVIAGTLGVLVIAGTQDGAHGTQAPRHPVTDLDLQRSSVTSTRSALDHDHVDGLGQAPSVLGPFAAVSASPPGRCVCCRRVCQRGDACVSWRRLAAVDCVAGLLQLGLPVPINLGVKRIRATRLLLVSTVVIHASWHGHTADCAPRTQSDSRPSRHT